MRKYKELADKVLETIVNIPLAFWTWDKDKTYSTKLGKYDINLWYKWVDESAVFVEILEGSNNLDTRGYVVLPNSSETYKKLEKLQIDLEQHFVVPSMGTNSD